jgi:hypothetical protein
MEALFAAKSPARNISQYPYVITHQYLTIIKTMGGKKHV